MARRLRMLGTTSEDGKCPTLYEDLDSGEVLVQGRAADQEDIDQMTNPLSGETMVVIPRELLTRFAPKE
ncbi:hypothetical protein ACFY3G_14870 [Streptomyces phaeochromogenes]|uniref:hypothetical protein n=1 Tax=Streptomyces phaeochromogenes TaxID=1923 RepID=UPI003689AAB3